MLSVPRVRPLLVASALAFALALAAGVLIWQMGSGQVRAQDGPPVGEEESRGDHNAQLANIGAEVAGFGGMYFEPGDESVLNVFLTDPNDADAVTDVASAIAFD